MKSSTKALLNTLVEIPTVAGDFAANNQALEYIDRFLSERGLFVKRLEFNGFESLIATTRQTKTPQVMLAAHLDVVPAPPEAFRLRETSSKLLGRGVLDMKSALAVYLQLVDELKPNMRQYDFGIMVTTDEELGGANGTPKLLEAGYLPQVCVLPDGGDNWQIQLHAKGFLCLSLTQQGKASHGSRPWLGQNAILELIKTVSEVEALFGDAGPDTHTFNVGTISGGQAHNQVAAHAETTLDIRFIDEAQKHTILSQIEEICKRNNTDLEVLIDGPVAEFHLDDPYIAPFAQLIEKHTGHNVLGSKTMGSNDTRFFTAYSIPCISFYPIGGGHHGDDEWIDSNSLEQFLAILHDYIELMAQDTADPTAKHILTLQK